MAILNHYATPAQPMCGIGWSVASVLCLSVCVGWFVCWWINYIFNHYQNDCV